MVEENSESDKGLRILARIIARVRLAENPTSAAMRKIQKRLKQNEDLPRTRRSS
jgi:hypothetical protein